MISGPKGTREEFVTRTLPGLQWSDVFVNEGRESLTVDGHVYRTLRMSHERDGIEGNTYHSIITNWRDVRTGVILKVFENQISGQSYGPRHNLDRHSHRGKIMRSGDLTVGTIGRRSIVAIALSGFALPRISRADEQSIVVDRLARVVIVAGDLDRLARFYATLGFAVDDARPAPDYATLANAGRARVRRMELGSEFAELVAFDPPGQPYPRPGRSTDPWFQHISLIAADMRTVMDQLQRAEGWTAISRSGPVHPARGTYRPDWWSHSLQVSRS